MSKHSDPLSQFILPILSAVRAACWLSIGLAIGWVLWGGVI